MASTGHHNEYHPFYGDPRAGWPHQKVTNISRYSYFNCQIACREANQAKGDLLVSEFVELCKKVIKYNQV